MTEQGSYFYCYLFSLATKVIFSHLYLIPLERSFQLFLPPFSQTFGFLASFPSLWHLPRFRHPTLAFTQTLMTQNIKRKHSKSHCKWSYPNYESSIQMIHRQNYWFIFRYCNLLERFFNFLIFLDLLPEIKKLFWGKTIHSWNNIKISSKSLSRPAPLQSFL